MKRDLAAPTLLATCAGVAALLVVAATARHGLGVSADSVSYLGAASDLAAGRAPLDAHGAPLVAWPPLYPAAVAATAFLTGQDVLDAARVLNAAVVVALVVLFSAMTRRLIPDPRLRGAAVIALAVSPTILLVSARALSELLFTLLVLGALWALIESTRRPTDPRVVLGAATLAAAASMTRYVGVTLIVVGVIALASRPRAALSFALVASAPLGTWLVRNLVVEGTLAGDRPLVGTPISDTARHVAEGVAGWVGPTGPMAIAVGIATLALLVAACARAWRATLPDDRSAVPICLFVLLYPVAIVVAATVVGLDPVSDRLLVPVWPPMLIIVLIALVGFTARGSARARRRVVAAGLGVWLLVAGAVTLHEARHLSRNGSGYTAARWQGSALVDEVGSLAPSEELVSNAPHALAFLTGRPAMGWRSAVPGSLVAWFDDPDRPVQPRLVVRASVAELADETGLDLVLERTTDDGRLLRVHPE